MEVPVGNSGLDLEGDKEEGEESDEDEDVPAELVRSMYHRDTLPLRDV